MEPIAALSLWEPWASLIAAGLKRHETRGWRTPHRGLLAIHASRKVEEDGAPAALCLRAFGPGWERNRPTGCVVAVAKLADCLPAPWVEADVGATTEDLLAGNFAEGRWAWRLDDVRPLRTPLPARGAQGLWRWTPPLDLDAQLAAPVSHRQAVALLQGKAVA